MSLGDDGDAVTAHDTLETAYYQERDRSRLTRWRMDLKAAADPFEPSDAAAGRCRIVVFGALAVWRLNNR